MEEFWSHLTDASPFTIALAVIVLIWIAYCIGKIVSTKRSKKAPTYNFRWPPPPPMLRPPPSPRPPPPRPQRPSKRVISEDVKSKRKVKIPKNRMIRED